MCCSPERGTQFFPLACSLCDVPLLVFVYFQVNNGVLYFLDYEDKLHHGPLCSRFNVVVNSYLSPMFDDVLFCLRCFSGVLCMAINVSVQYDGGLLSDIILLTQ